VQLLLCNAAAGYIPVPSDVLGSGALHDFKFGERGVGMSGGQPTVRIWHENLAAMAGNDRKPLSALTPEDHVHGGLRLEIAGRVAPCLGYWGPDDVCFGQWLEELWHAAEALSTPGGRHTFDEGEQGQPAFVFEREGDRGFFTIAASEISDGEADPDWQRVEFLPADFLAAHDNFRTSFCAELRGAAPAVAALWLGRFDLKQGSAERSAAADRPRE
jgi:hypothetical protein